MFKGHFFGSDPASSAAYCQLLEKASETLLRALPEAPYSACSPLQLRSLICKPELGVAGSGGDEAIAQLAVIVRNSVAVWHPRVAAHLHTPVLNIALVAELVISALNQSMDSFDQAPAATIVEQQMVAWLCRLCGLPAEASGTFTPGGTQSNYMGLLLARDFFVERKWRWNVREKGLPPQASRLRIVCSELAHFSVEKSAIQLGLGTESVVKVPVDARFRMCPVSLRDTLSDLHGAGLEPFAIAATAGTTDFGSIDPLLPIAAIASEQQVWLHVDAAYGGALLLSTSRRSALAGIERADSVTVDFHKAFFQPISCSAFLLADSARFRFIRVHADYLNPESREDAGIPDLVTNSLLTTRRFDALKLWVSLQTLGVSDFGHMIDRLAELASFAAETLRSRGCFEVLHEPVFSSVVFRYRPERNMCSPNEVNSSLPSRLFASGEAVLGHTVVAGQPHLKITVCNPCTSTLEIAELIERVEALGRQIESEVPSLAGV